MSLRCGIVGLPNVGKSTLFNAMTAARAAAANYPFCTIEPNVGVVTVPDERLNKIAAIFQPEKITPTTIEFVDIAGLVKGASQGEGLGNQFLGHIRNVDAIVHVVRCFDDPDVVHVHGHVDPVRDIEVVETELMLADLEALSKRIQKVEKKAKSGDKESSEEYSLCLKMQKELNAGIPIRHQSVQDPFLISAKPVLYVANVAEDQLHQESESLVALKKFASQDGSPVIVISGKIESEIAELSSSERKTFLADLNLKESGLDQLSKAGYQLLKLVTFFTAGKQEVRAWTIPQGTKAPQAAGVIHSDFEKGFIRAECYHDKDLLQYGSEAKLREAGKIRLEGKDYIVQDGDVLFFRFNV